MVRMLVILLITSGLIHFAIEAWRHFTGKERWKFVKTLSYSLGIGALAVCLLTAIVILF